MYQIINIETGESHGIFHTLDEAQRQIVSDKLTTFDIWNGDELVETSEELY